ncbi:MAG: FAD-dependent oxidoreductase, partial [Candidatus Altiarchaeales archaeon]|nr:FAD-dependent oxidoreductase [Candidatus Altiarchaeales archaeon]
MKNQFDALIIGGGVVGCAIARELSRYKLRTLLVEKLSDVAMGASGRNSGVIHAGFYVKPGSLKAKLNVKGQRMMPGICQKLDVPYQRVGKLVVAKDKSEVERLYKLKETGERNGVRNLKIIDREEMRRVEPNVVGVEAMHSPDSAIVDPFILTIAFAENAIKNGVRILIDTEVLDIKENNGFVVKTNNGEFKSDLIINSAGLFSDKIAGMLGVNEHKIYPCRGEYHILDKNYRYLINGMLYPLPPEAVGGLGVHLTPTTDDNIFLGPSAEYIEDVNDTATTSPVMETLYQEARELIPKVSMNYFIRSFAGIRPKLVNKNSREPGDFVIEEPVSNFINLQGIESPGLTAAPAIAEFVVELIGGGRELAENLKFNPERKAPVRFNKLSDQEKSELIKKNPNYGQIVCRCETVTKQEIIDALKNPLGARSIYGIRKRAKATCG